MEGKHLEGDNFNNHCRLPINNPRVIYEASKLLTYLWSIGSKISFESVNFHHIALCGHRGKDGVVAILVENAHAICYGQNNS